MELVKLMLQTTSGYSVSKGMGNLEESPADQWAAPPCAHQRPTALQPTSSETMSEGRQRPPLLEHLAHGAAWWVQAC